MPLSCQGNQDASLTPAGKFVNQIKIQISTMAQSAERSANNPLRVMFRDVRMNLIICMKDNLLTNHNNGYEVCGNIFKNRLKSSQYHRKA